MSTTSIALIGFGAIARKHLGAIRASENVAAVGVVDPSPEAREAAAGEKLRVFDDLDDLLAAPGLDGVILSTPNQLHAEAAVRCIEAGLPVLVEKPLSDSAEGGRRILKAQRKFGTPVLVGHHRRHNPLIAKAREIVQSGAIGRITAISAFAMFLKPDDYFDVAWRREPGGGPVLINLIHDIDNLRYLCGEIVAVEAMLSDLRRGLPVEDTAAVIARFENGALGTLIVSDTAAAPWSWELTSGENPAFPQQAENCYFITGTEGALALPKLELWQYEDARGWQAPLTREVIQVEAGDPYLLQLGNFLDVIHGRADPLVTAESAQRTLEVTLAVHRAALGEPTLVQAPR